MKEMEQIVIDVQKRNIVELVDLVIMQVAIATILHKDTTFLQPSIIIWEVTIICAREQITTTRHSTRIN